jgi:hypothetical protein
MPVAGALALVTMQEENTEDTETVEIDESMCWE